MGCWPESWRFGLVWILFVVKASHPIINMVIDQCLQRKRSEHSDLQESRRSSSMSFYWSVQMLLLFIFSDRQLSKSILSPLLPWNYSAPTASTTAVPHHHTTTSVHHIDAFVLKSCFCSEKLGLSRFLFSLILIKYIYLFHSCHIFWVIKGSWFKINS